MAILDALLYQPALGAVFRWTVMLAAVVCAICYLCRAILVSITGVVFEYQTRKLKYLAGNENLRAMKERLRREAEERREEEFRATSELHPKEAEEHRKKGSRKRKSRD